MSASPALPNSLPTDGERLAWVAATMLLDKHRNVSTSWFQQLGRALVIYGCTPVRAQGRLWDAPVPGLRLDTPLKSTRSAFRRDGVTRERLALELHQARMRDDVLPCVRRDWAEYAIDPAVWPAVVAVAEDGPLVAKTRLERAIEIESTRKVRASRRRPDGGTVSRGYLEGCVKAMVRLFRVLVELCESRADLPFVDQWTRLPGRFIVSGAETNSDTSGPPRTTLRLVHAHVDRQVAERLGIEPGQDEFEAIALMSKSTLKDNAVFTALRVRAMFDLFAVTGMRSGALVGLRRCDFEPRHRCYDGELRPALAVRPAKSVKPDVVRWKILPPRLAAEIAAVTAALRKVSPHPLAPDGALLPGAPSRPNSHMVRESVGALFTGLPPSRFRLVERVALVPFNVAALRSSDGLGPDDYLGYSPQRVRHAALQMTREGATMYMREHGLDMDPECLSEVLLDHNVSSDRYGYADVSTERGRERWTAVAIETNWNMLTGDLGARHARDGAAFREAVRERNAVAAEITRRRELIDSAFAGLERTARKPRHGDQAVNQILDLLRGQIAVSRDIQHERRLEQRRLELEVELQQLRHDPSRLIVVPDDAPKEALNVNLDAIEREESARRPGAVLSSGELPRVREWITVNELAQISGVSRPSARRWTSGQLLPFPAGDSRNPWTTPVPPVDQGEHGRRRRISVRDLSPNFLAPTARARLLNEILATWPVGWSVEECERPLQLPDVLHSEQ